MKLCDNLDLHAVFKSHHDNCTIKIKIKNKNLFAEESMDVDPNYDPSDFLLAGLPTREEKDINSIQDDLAVSESDEENDNAGATAQANQECQQPPQPDEDVGGDLWF